MSHSAFFRKSLFSLFLILSLLVTSLAVFPVAANEVASMPEAEELESITLTGEALEKWILSAKQTVLLGDANRDGRVDVTDTGLILVCIASGNFDSLWLSAEIPDVLYTDNGDGTCTLDYVLTWDGGAFVIPATSPDGKPVTGIGDRAFAGCTSLTAVYIPACVTAIGANAFSGCTALKTVITDSAAVVSLLTSATACGHLTGNAKTVAIPEGVTAGNYLTSHFSHTETVAQGENTYTVYADHAHAWQPGTITGHTQLYTCSVCDLQKNVCVHHFVITDEGTGTHVEICEYCGTEGQRSAHAPASGSTPMCGGFTCAGCGAEIPLVHTWGAAPDCIHDQTCTRCGESNPDALATGIHTAPAGTKACEDYTCTVCATPVAAVAEHNYVDNVCTECGITLITVGCTVKFGTYEQDNYANTGKEDIEWTVLAVDGTKALLISKYALDCVRYNTAYEDVTWETCTLREWLNGTFYDTAFSTADKKKIVQTTVNADSNPNYSTDPGNATSDNVFLLSVSEANQYFSDNGARQCSPTAYAKAQGLTTNDPYPGESYCQWWLRTPGNYQVSAACVDFYGATGAKNSNSIATNASIAVRPAIWIDLAP